MKAEFLTRTNAEGGFPHVVYPPPEQSPAEFMGSAHEEICAELQGSGAVLIRGICAGREERFPEFVRCLVDRAIPYVYRSTPRTEIAPGIFTATEYPAHQSIPLHNENAYQRSWPMLLAFCCVQSAAEGGNTLIACNRRVTQQIDPAVRDAFTRRRVMYVRNYQPGVDLPWQTVFQTTERARVEAYCREHEIDFEWLGTNHLRTRQICQAVAAHPKTGETLWFNQAHLFHVSSLSPAIRSALETIYDERDLPRNAYYGDGGRIEEDVLRQVRAAYETETTLFDWRTGDVLLLDNMLVAHGRSPYKGTRKVLVAMSDRYPDQLRQQGPM